MAKKEKTEWVIVEDGRKIVSAATRAKAEAMLCAITKKLPLGMSFDFKVEEHHCTTCN